MRKLVAAAAVGAALATIATVAPTVAVAHDGHETEEFEETIFTGDLCYGYAVKLSIVGQDTVHTTEQAGKATQKGEFAGTFSWVVLDEETGKPDKHNGLNSEGRFKGAYVDRYETDEQNKDDEYVSAVRSDWKGGGSGTSDNGLEFTFTFSGAEKLAPGGYANDYEDYEDKLRRIQNNLDCSAKHS